MYSVQTDIIQILILCKIATVDKNHSLFFTVNSLSFILFLKITHLVAVSLSRLSINSLTLFTLVLGLKCPILHHVREVTSVSVVEQKLKLKGIQAHNRLLKGEFTNWLMIHKQKKTKEINV